MPGGPGRAFHVACPHTGAAICGCSLGAPSEVSTSHASQQYYQQARALWELWKDSSGMQQRRAGVDVMVPALYRREMTLCDKDNGTEGDLPSCEDAAKALKAAKRAAADLSAKAAKLSPIAGVEGKPVKGTADKPRSPKKHSKKGCDALQAEIAKLEEEMMAMDAERQALEADKSSKEETIKQKIREKEQNLAEVEKRRLEKSKVLLPTRPSANHNFSQEQGSPGSAHINHHACQPPSTREPQTRKVSQGGRPHDVTLPQHVTGTPQAASLAKDPNRITGQKRRSDAHQNTPKRKLSRLTVSDFSGDLLGRYLKVFWPDDQQWWTVRVHSIDAKNRTAQLLYETDEMEKVNLLELIQRGEVAFHSERPAQWALGAVSEGVASQAEPTLLPISQGVARGDIGPPAQRQFPSPFGTAPPPAGSRGTAQQKHRVAGQVGPAAMPAMGLAPSHVRDVLRLGSAVIGQQVQVLLPKDGVWMKAKVVAADCGNDSMVVQLDIGAEMTLKGGDLVRLV